VDDRVDAEVPMAQILKGECFMKKASAVSFWGEVFLPMVLGVCFAVGSIGLIFMAIVGIDLANKGNNMGDLLILATFVIPAVAYLFLKRVRDN
jgi:hypothetical protein